MVVLEHVFVIVSEPPGPVTLATVIDESCATPPVVVNTKIVTVSPGLYVPSADTATAIPPLSELAAGAADSSVNVTVNSAVPSSAVAVQYNFQMGM